jgi:hypothetical protein
MSSAFNATIKLYRRIAKRMGCGTRIRGIFSLFDIKKTLQRLVIAAGSKSMKSKLIPQMWFHECYNVFTIRLNESEIEIFEDLLTSVYTKYFQEDAPDSSRIFSDLNISEPYEERQIYRSLTDIESSSLSRRLDEKFPQIMSYPSSLSYICKIDANLGNRTSFTMVKTSVGDEIVAEYTRAAAFLRGYELIEINLGIYEETLPTWPNIFKGLLKKIIFSSTTTVLLVTLDAGCKYNEIWSKLSI